MRAAFLALSLASGAALPLAGCGLLLNSHESPQQAAIRREYSPVEPRARAFAGEIRDFATYRLEPAAGLEFWSEDSEYVPVARLDGRGGFVLHVDLCRREATFEDQLFHTIFIGSQIDCTRWLGRYAFRARQGTRCSVSHPDGERPGHQQPLVLWLRDCPEATTSGRAWRSVATTSTAGQ